MSHGHPAIRKGGAQAYAFELYEALREQPDFEPILLARAKRPDPTLSPRHRDAVIASAASDPNQYLMYTDSTSFDWVFGRTRAKDTLTRDFRAFLEAVRPDVVHFQHTMLIGYDAIRMVRLVLPEASILYTLQEFGPICHRNGQMVRTKRNQLCREASPRRCHECFPDIPPALFFARERFIRSQFNLVDRFIAPSNTLRERYIDWGLAEEKVLHEDYGRLLPRSPSEPERGGPRNRFAFFGQLTQFKGADILLKAMAVLGDEFDGHLWIHGANLENEPPQFQQEFRELLEATPETVTFAGPYDHAEELTKMMMAADWTVVPSIWWENSPLVIQEAFHHRRPVICSDIGGMAEKVEHGVSGLQFRRGDAQHLAETMRQAAETPGLWEELRSGIPPVYSMDDHVARLRDIYQEVGGERRALRTAARSETTAPAVATSPPRHSTGMASSKPKVLFVSHNHPHIRTGGAEVYALNLYEAIRDAAEFEPVFLARTGSPANLLIDELPLHPHAPVTSVNEDPNQYLIYTDFQKLDYFMHRSSDTEAATKHYCNFLLAHKPDIVHFQHSYMIGYDWLRVTKNTLPDVSIVYMLHEYLAICNHDGQLIRTHTGDLCREQTPRRCHECFPSISPQKFLLRSRFIKSHLNLVDVFIAPSEYVRDRYVDWGIPTEKVQVEPYAMPAIERPSEPDPDRPRNRFAFFGQFTPHKGIDVLLRAMALLGNNFDGHLWIHGAGLENQTLQFQEEFRELLEATSETVTFAGPYDHAEELTKMMMAADWTVVPSIWWETGPLVVLESFQHGRPVICSDIGGMSEKVEHGVSGLHFSVRDAESLADTLARAADTRGLWEELHAGIPPVYEIGDHAEVVTDIYRRLLARRQAAAVAAGCSEATEVLSD